MRRTLSPWREKVLLFFLVISGVEAMVPEMMSFIITLAPTTRMNPESQITSENHNMTQGFPPLPAHFMEMANKLMLKCFQNGHTIPMTMMMMGLPHNSSYMSAEDSSPNPFSMFRAALSSLPYPEHQDQSGNQSNSTMDFPSYNLDWNITDRIWNCTSLPHIISVLKNSTDSPQCFMRAFIAPLSWSTLMSTGGDLDPQDFAGLIWAAKPFLQDMLPQQLSLPPQLQKPHLVEMMKMFSEVFSSLSKDQRVQIREWAKGQVTLSAFNCSIKSPGVPTPTSQSALQRACPPHIKWLGTEEMKMMGPFLSQLPVDDIIPIPKEELCPFFKTPQFCDSFRGVGVMDPALGKMMFQRVRECSQSSEDFHKHLNSLGSLACFYDDDTPLNVSLSKMLLSQLGDCENSGVTPLKRRLVEKVMMFSGDSHTPELLQELGSGVSALSPAQLAQFPPTALLKSLSTLGQSQWTVSQARTLAQNLLPGSMNVSADDLLCLGSVVRGVDSQILRTVKPQGLLGNDKLETICQKMSTLQKTAILERLRGSVNASELVRSVPNSLLPRLSMVTLEQAGLSSVDQLEGRSWTRPQSAHLLRKLVGRTIRPQDIRKLGAALQGVDCDMINSTNTTDVEEMAQALTESLSWLSNTQITCAAQKLFEDLERKRSGYFLNISDSELNTIPAILLIHLPVGKLGSFPASVCPRFLEKMAQVNLSSLPLNSPSRPALVSRVLDCMGKNLSMLSSTDVSSLGPLVCELGPSQLSKLSPEALNTSLLCLASCSQLHPSQKGALFQLVKDKLGDPSDWSSDTMASLGPLLLLLNDSSLLSLRYTPWLKPILSDLLGRIPSLPSPPPPEQFRTQPDLSTLRRKLFLVSTMGPTPSNRRRREAVPVAQPTVALIEELAQENVHWSTEQLASMAMETFTATTATLGEISDYSTEQLGVLKEKVLQTLGPVELLNETLVIQLGCLAQAFSPSELHSLHISSPDTLELLSPCRWTQPQREAVWKAFMNNTAMTVATLGAVEIAGLGQFICGMSPNETRILSTATFREAVELLGKIQCPIDVLERLKDLAIAAFGAPSTWSHAQVNCLGNIIAGLNASELQSLSSSVLSFLTPSSVPLIVPSHLAALSASQLQALGPDNAAMVTATQLASLGEAQKVALGNAVGVPYSRTEELTQNPTIQAVSPQPLKSGASALSIMVAVVLLQPFLLLFGFNL